MPKNQKDILKNDLAKQKALLILYNYFFVIIVLVIALILLSGWWFFLKAKYEDVSSGRELDSKRGELDAKYVYLSQLKALEKVYGKISLTDKAKIDYIINSNDNQNDLLQEMELIALSYKVKIKSLTTQVADQSVLNDSRLATTDLNQNIATRIEVIEVSFSLEQIDYETLVKILHKLENNLRLMDVQKINYDPINQKVDLQLFTYHLKSL